MNLWQEKELGDCINFKRGYDLPQRLREEGEIPIYSSSGISGWHKKSKIKPPGVITGRYGSIGNVYFSDSAYWPLNTTLYIQDFKGNDPLFIFYFLKTINWQTFNDKSAVPGINRNDLHTASVLFPSSIEEQKAIAAVLSCLDRKIENLRKQNETLEAIAQTLFKRWFIDFEFPYDFAQGKPSPDGQPYKSSGGAMQPSELGDIPEGWRVGILGEEFNISIGKTPPRKENHWFSSNSQDVRWASIKDMGNAGVFINQTSESLTSEAIRKYNVNLIPDNTLILSFKLTVGRVSLTIGEMVSNEAIAHIKCGESYVSSEFLYLFFKQFNFDKLGSTSSIATAVNSKTIKSIDIILPSQNFIAFLMHVIHPIFGKIKSNMIQIQALTKTRDTLLPKLMSGQLRITP